MLFWLIAGILALIAACLVVVPIWRQQQNELDSINFDKEVYQARLGEIDKEFELGRLTADEVEAAKAEEGRRLIQASEFSPKNSGGQARANSKVIGGAVAIIVPLFSLLYYQFLGSPTIPDQPLASRQVAPSVNETLLSLLERAEAQLAKNPEDGRGWRVVAPVYLQLGRFDDAIKAYRNSIRLNDFSRQEHTSLGEVLVIKAQGIVNSDARTLFEKALEKSPKDAKARFFLAIALGQESKHEEAVGAWRGLLENAPPEAPWVPVAIAQMNAQLEKLGKPPEQPKLAETLSGPSQEDVKNAEQMSPEDRMAMIEGMVASLSEKLKEDPTNEAGWRRLLRSYMVLKRDDELKQALADARQALPDNAEFQTFLNSVEAASGKQVQGN